MSEDAETNLVRKWRKQLGLTLDQACDLFPKRGFERPSIAKLSRIERDQSVPLDDVPAVAAVTGIPAKELRPDIAELLGVA
jgi:transcriptional regulator with XRE-family HTH domain